MFTCMYVYINESNPPKVALSYLQMTDLIGIKLGDDSVDCLRTWILATAGTTPHLTVFS